jgi:iron complex outermembrane recepter protein
MNKIFLSNSYWQKTIAFLALMLFTCVFTYAQTISGTVNSDKGEKLPGVSVVIKGTTKGTTTDRDGKYVIDAKSGETLVFSFVGYLSKEISINNQTVIDLNLTEDAQSLDEVIVTGVFDKRTAIQSSIAISKLDSKAIARLAPNSAADLLSFTPGVFVNSALGEINNTVYSRGVNANQFTPSGVNGYYYVSLMEDGLPVTNITSGTVVADRFYRADATLANLESVRGGSAAIASNNAPGGIFNYISNTGLKPVNEIAYKVGLEGDGINLFNRIDANFGGKLGKNNWYYNIGGFYRHSDGQRYPGYAQNKGGQIKANVVKTLANGGMLKFYAKILDDRNGIPQNLPAQNYDNPTIVNGFSNTFSYMLPAGESKQPLWNNTDSFTFDPSKLIHSQDKMLGSELNLNLKNGWTLTNNIRGSLKGIEQDITIMSTPTSLTSVLTYALMGMAGPGQFSFKDRATGQELATVSADFSRGPSFTVTKNNLPGQSIVPNAVLFNFSNYIKAHLGEVIDQITVNKKLGKHSITAGSYLAFTNFITDIAGTANTSLRPIENLASPLDITWTNPAGVAQKVTNPLGYARLSGGGLAFRSADVKQNQVAFFLNDGFQPIEKLNIDLGLRIESIGVKGGNQIGVPTPTSTTGGLDGNLTTLFDNSYFVKGTTVSYNSKLNLFSYSGGVNYLLNKGNSIYARFSNSQKAPDYGFYNDNFTNPSASPEVKAQTITQFELGYKFKGKKASGSIIPFYSNLSNIPVTTIAQETDGTAYYTPVVYNEIRTLGLEAEVNINFTKNLSLNANATYQDGIATTWQNWLVGVNGRADDKIADFNGNRAVNIPKLMANISPIFTYNKGFVMLNYKYMGARPANIANVFDLPGFGQLNLSAGYDISKKLSLNANINNLTNVLGIMNWMATSQFALVDGFNHNSFTAERRQTAPNSIFQILPVQPRAYFLTVKYKF